MLIGTVSLFSLRNPKKTGQSLVVVSVLCVFGALAGSVHADAPTGDEPRPKLTVRGAFQGDAFVIERTSTFQIKGIKSATDSARQNLLMVPDLMEQAKALAQVTSDVPTLIAVWQAQRAVGDTDGAKQTLVVARKMADQSVYLRPVPLCVIAEAQAQADDKKSALATLAEAFLLVDLNKSPRQKVEFLDEIAQAQIKIGDVAGAKTNFAAAQHLAEAMPASDDKDKDAALFKIACLQGALGDFTGAKNTADTIQTAQYKVFSLCFTADEQLKAGDTAGAKLSLDYAVQAAAPSQDSYDLQRIAQVQAAMGDFKGAKATADKISLSDKNDSSNADYRKSMVFLSIVQAKAKSGDIDGAKSSAALIPDNNELKVYVLSAVGQGQAKQGDLAGAKATFARAKYLAASVGYVDGPAWAYFEIAQAEMHARLFVDLKDTITKIDDARTKTAALAQLVNAIVEDAKKQSITVKEADKAK